jgi:predicted N-acetyltransferase YhbS
VSDTIDYVESIDGGPEQQPLLEVLPDYQGRGIGRELMQRVLAHLQGLSMVDLCCDADLEPYYARLGFFALERGMRLRA